MTIKSLKFDVISLSFLFFLTVVISAMPFDSQAQSLSVQISNGRHHSRHHPPPRVSQRSHRFPKIGHRVRRLPGGFLRVMAGTAHFFFHHGVFYRKGPKGYLVVRAPIGAVVKSITAGYTVIRMGTTTYYHYNDTYYAWDDSVYGYVVVADPTTVSEISVPTSNASRPKLFMYPKQGQSEDQQSKDRYACHRWGVERTGFDPSLGDPPASQKVYSDYRRAMTACLDARGYTVK